MIFSEKKAGESVSVGFDLVRLLGAGESIQSVVFSIATIRGTDPAPASMISGAATVSLTKVRQRIVGGVADCYYEVSATAVTSAGNTYIERATLPVIA